MAIQTTNKIELTAFDGSIVELQGQFLLSHCTDGCTRITGDVLGTDSNIVALVTVNNGSKPDIDFDDKGNEVAPTIPVNPNNDKPLWKYVKPSKKDNTTGYVYPIQSVSNRDTTASDVEGLRQSVLVHGYDTKRRALSIVVDVEGYARFGDGGHMGTALGQLHYVNGNKLDNSVIPIQVIYETKQTSGIAGWDELQKSRSVAHVLQAQGLTPLWESECQIALSNLILLCSGKTLKGSGKSLPHIVDDSGKPRKLSESEVVTLYKGEPKAVTPFDKIQSVLEALSTAMLSVVDENDEETEIAIWESSTFKRFNAGSWVTAIIETSIACNIDATRIVETLAASIQNDNKYAAKINSWAPAKGSGTQSDNFPILCSILTAMGLESDLPSRKPNNRASVHIKIAYDSWRDANNV